MKDQSTIKKNGAIGAQCGGTWWQNPSYPRGRDPKEQVQGQPVQKVSETSSQQINLAWQHTAVIPATREATDSRIMVQTSWAKME
jgi:hypothetical protein